MPVKQPVAHVQVVVDPLQKTVYAGFVFVVNRRRGGTLVRFSQPSPSPVTSAPNRGLP
jgi:hypothetical protein